MKFKVGDIVRINDNSVDFRDPVKLVHLDFDEEGPVVEHPEGWSSSVLGTKRYLFVSLGSLELVESCGDSPSQSPQLRGGTKHDNGKSDLSLIPYSSLEDVARVLMMGQEKYGRSNWKKGIRTTRLLGAAFRHLGAFSDGINNDIESNQSHVAHAICNLLFLLYMMKNHPEMDDRHE